MLIRMSTFKSLVPVFHILFTETGRTQHFGPSCLVKLCGLPRRPTFQNTGNELPLFMQRSYLLIEFFQPNLKHPGDAANRRIKNNLDLLKRYPGFAVMADMSQTLFLLRTI